MKASTDSVENLRLKKKERVFRTKKQRKELKERKREEKDIAEADAQVSAEDRERLQSETLKIVFGLYFKILKQTEDSAMLSVVLDGISRSARLINAEFFGDLLEVLREILEKREDQTTNRDQSSKIREVLVCLDTAFTLLKNQGSSHVDLSHFITRFHELMSDISLCPRLLSKPSRDERSLIELVIRVADAILFTPLTPPSPSRILTFYKRFLTCALQLEEGEAQPIMGFLQKLSGRFERKIGGLWDEEGTALTIEGTPKWVRGWELSLLGQHYCADVMSMSAALYRLASKGNVEQPEN